MRGTVISKKLQTTIRSIVLAGLLLPAAPSIIAQTNASPSRPANRWLLIVETSRAMERRAQAAQQMVNTLLLTGMNGQMHAGDTVGVWIYNDELYARGFELQTWAPASSRTVASRVLLFLQGQKFQKKGRFVESVRPAMQAVLRNSDYITVVIISDGEEKMQGTPFDDQINKYYESWRDEQEKANLPFLTLLRAERDQITGYTVNSPPWPLEFPPLPAAMQPPKPAPVAQKPPPQPVIITGKKPASVATQEVAQAAVTTSEPALPLVQPATSGAARPDETGAAPATAERPLTESAQPPVAGSPRSTAVSVAESKPDESAVRAPEPSAAPSGSGTARHSGLPNELLVAARADPNAGSAPAARPTNAPVRATASMAVAPVVPAVPPATFWSRNWIWAVSAATLIGVVLVLVLWLRRRAREPLHVSLITRSVDGRKK